MNPTVPGAGLHCSVSSLKTVRTERNPIPDHSCVFQCFDQKRILHIVLAEGQPVPCSMLMEMFLSSSRPRVDRADIIRCVKSCQPNDISCVLNPILTISHTAISLPTFREFTKPEEIVFLRSATPSHFPHMESPEIVYEILDGNVNNSFDIIKRLEHGMIVGVVRQVKPLIGSLSTVLKLAMNYVTNGVVSHRNIINVHIFVSEFWF